MLNAATSLNNECDNTNKGNMSGSTSGSKPGGGGTKSSTESKDNNLD
jgi:hypothetical protein